ncbi:MAG: bifunctional nuclease family protein [Myxococcota bacterium]|nr:bifunctional nuclease family protein [Myxococcota bacterium]
MSSDESKQVEMIVAGVAIEPSNQVPVVILAGDRDRRIMLPIAIGDSEAASIAAILGETEMPRPMTHDLMATALRELGRRVVQLRITHVDEGIFYGLLCLVDEDGNSLELDCRPSDGIALALRFEAEILVDPGVLMETANLAPEESLPEDMSHGGSRAVPPSIGPEVDLEDLDPDLFGDHEM